MGFRPHQAVLALAGVAIIAAWLFSAHAPWWWVPVGVATASMALPVSGADTVGSLVGTGLNFYSRSRWHVLEVLDVDQGTMIMAKGSSPVRCYRLGHRGRLDLAEGDLRVGEALRDLTDSLAQRSSETRLSLHVLSRGDAPITILALEPDINAPRGWSDGVDLASVVAPAPGVLERWTYLRRDATLLRCYRVLDFSAVQERRTLLETLLREVTTTSVSLMVEVLPSSRARRLTARAAHQLDSDVAAASAAGFRRSARTSARQARLARREVSVAQGRALLRVAVYVTTEAANLHDLREAHRSLWRGAQEAGLQLERGVGRQFRWWSAQLPGGPVW